MRIVLTHIPRTGGTSLFRAMTDQLPDAKAGEFDSFSELALMSDRELNSYQIISTYIGSRLLDRLDGAWTKVVVLRDPLTRLKSSYWHLRTSLEHISFASSLAKSASFEEYMASRCAAVTFQATNVQTWTVFGDKSINYRRKHAATSSDDILKMALDRLVQYDFIGFTENLDKLWLSLSHHLSIPESRLPHMRVNPTCPDLYASPVDLAFHMSLDSEFLSRARTLRD